MTEQVRDFRILVSYRGGLAADHNPGTPADHETAAGFPPEGQLDSQDIKEAGLKVTGPRLKILAVLEHSDRRHLSAEDVHNALLDKEDDVGLATVYRVLTQFEGAGLVTRHHFEGGQSVFELNRGGHHDHLVCVRCGKVVEFFEAAIEVRQEAIALEHGFTIQDHSLVIYGVCADCRPVQEPAAPS
jgi:Fur family ferric uptake transcriptional regulator